MPVPSEFIIGDKAVYPSQGVAEVIGIEKKEVYGKIQNFYVLRGLETGLRILVPIDKADQVGLRKVAIAMAGFSVLGFGVALLVVPIPGTSLVVIPLGLAILARQFKWAQTLLDWSTAAVRRIWAGVRRLFGGRPAVPAPLPCP